MTATTSQITDYDVIVVGAGAAGLAATRSLRDCGTSVICLEASDRIGGRTHTDANIFGVPCDLGAHWLHSDAINPFVEIGRSLGFDIYPAPDNFVTIGDPTGKAMDHEKNRLYEALEKAAKSGEDTAASGLFPIHNDWSLIATLSLVLSMARDLPGISATDCVSAQSGSDSFCRQGFGALVAKSAKGIPVRLNAPVREITATSNGVELRTDQGALNARAAIVTVSQGILAAGDIRFDPPLSNDMNRAVETINLGTYNHAVLQFEPGTLPVEPDTWLTYQISETTEGSPKGGGFLCDIAGSGLASFESAGAFGRELELAGQDTMLDFGLTTLVGLFGSDIRKSFIKGHATQWGENHWVKGAYSGANPGCSHHRADLRTPHAERVFFAGEATHLTEQATVSGAHKEGLRAAELALNCCPDRA